MLMKNQSPPRRFHWESAEDDIWHMICEYAVVCSIVVLTVLYFLTLLDAAGV